MTDEKVHDTINDARCDDPDYYTELSLACVIRNAASEHFDPIVADLTAKLAAKEKEVEDATAAYEYIHQCYDDMDEVRKTLESENATLKAEVERLKGAQNFRWRRAVEKPTNIGPFLVLLHDGSDGDPDQDHNRFYDVRYFHTDEFVDSTKGWIVSDSEVLIEWAEIQK
jgi:hypothetical protein